MLSSRRSLPKRSILNHDDIPDDLLKLKSISEDFSTLSSDLHAIQNAQVDVSWGLVKATGLALIFEFQPDLLPPLAKLTANWAVYAINLSKLIYQSANIADDCNTSLDVYLTDVLDPIANEDVDAGTKKRILQRYTQTLQNDGAREQELSQGFVDLRHELVKFTSDVKAVLPNSLSQAMVERRDRAMKDIESLDERIKSLYRSQMDRENSQRTDDESGDTSRQIGDARNDRAQLFANVRFANDMDSIVRYIYQQLDAAMIKVKDVIPRVGNFATVWASLRHDTQQLSDILKMIEEDADYPPQILANRIEASKREYTKLRTALQNYIKALS